MLQSQNFQTQLNKRETFLSGLVSSLSADERFVAAWLTGSLSHGNADALSDLDLRVVVAEPYAAALCARAQSISAQTTPERLALFSQFGEPLMMHENNYNAPPDGSFTFVMYAESNVMVDWILMPQANAERPTSSILLFDKVGIPLSPVVQPETLAQRAEAASERVAFFWMMTAITTKYILRGDSVFVAQWLEQLHEIVAEVERLLAGNLFEYHRGSLTTLAPTHAEQIQAIRQLAAQMEHLMPKVVELGGYVGPSPVSTIEQLIQLEN
jgi:Streptomycin adenylyltransferase